MEVKDKDEFLRSQRIMRLATVGVQAAGYAQMMPVPHVVPVWYMYDTKKFYVGTNSSTQKARNVRQQGRVSFCIDVGVNSPDIYGLMGQGTARLITGEHRVKKIARKIMLRYFETLQDNEAAEELLNDTDCIIEISPERIYTWSY